jgi:DNA-binding transcriptional regulator YiaG
LPNIAVVLKEEIARLARKELRNETEKLKKMSAQYRSEIAALKRRAAALEQQISRLSKANGSKAQPAPEAPSRVRFSAKGFQAQRGRLGLSAALMGKLLGVSGQTIYNWEAGTTRPRAEQLAAIADLRGAGKRRVASLLEGLE